MKTATVHDVGRDFSTVLDWVKSGEEVQVLENDHPVAVISPPFRRVQHPDYAARLKRIFGDKVIGADTSAAIRDLMKGER